MVALVLAATPAPGSTWVATGEFDAKAAREADEAVRDFCRKAARAKGRVDKVLPIKRTDENDIANLARLLLDGSKGCPRDPDLAVALLELLIAGRSDFAVETGLLGDLRRALISRGRPNDLLRAEELNRVLWVRWIGTSPNWGEAERRAFIARDDVWAFVTDPSRDTPRSRELRIEAWLDPLSPRFDPARGVDALVRGGPDDQRRAAQILLAGEGVPPDPERAERVLLAAAARDDAALAMLLDRIEPRLAGPVTPDREYLLMELWRIAQRSIKDPALRERLVRIFTPRLGAADPASQRFAATVLAALYRQGTESAAPALLDWIDRSLTGQDAASQRAAMVELARLVMAGSAPARILLDREFARSGGLVEAGAWTPDPERPVPFERILTGDDYPLRAARSGTQGVVQARAVIGPDRRVLLVEIVGSPDAVLSETVVKLVMRRLRRSYPDHPGRYVRVTLPPIQFRVIGCDKDKALPEVLPGAVLVEARMRCNHPAF